MDLVHCWPLCFIMSGVGVEREREQEREQVPLVLLLHSAYFSNLAHFPHISSSVSLS